MEEERERKGGRWRTGEGEEREGRRGARGGKREGKEEGGTGGIILQDARPISR